MRRRSWVLPAAILFALGVPWALEAQETKGVDIVEVGWWSSRPGALPKENDGFEVGAAPNGNSISVAAIRLDIPLANVQKLAVSLNEESGFGHELGGLKLCTTTAPWNAANPGAMANAPAPDCSVNVFLTRTDDGKWLGDVARLAPLGGEVSIMVLPVINSPTLVGSGMIVTIAGGEFVATGTPATTTTSSGSTGTTEFTPTTDFFIDDFSGPVVTGSFGTPSFEEPQVALTETTLPPEDDEGTDDFALDPVSSPGGPGKPWLRLGLLLPLSAGFGIGSVYLRRELEERGLLAT